jgi:aspartate 1-decarboxylase
MKRTFLYAKLHQARVTQADPDYEGSFAIDADILDASSILENEQIHVYNIDNANRFVTYAIRAPRSSKTMSANGACAHLVSLGDRVIICAFAEMEEKEWKVFQPRILFLDKNNNYSVKELSAETSIA